MHSCGWPAAQMLADGTRTRLASRSDGAQDARSPKIYAGRLPGSACHADGCTACTRQGHLPVSCPSAQASPARAHEQTARAQSAPSTLVPLHAAHTSRRADGTQACSRPPAQSTTPVLCCSSPSRNSASSLPHSLTSCRGLLARALLHQDSSSSNRPPAACTLATRPSIWHTYNTCTDDAYWAACSRAAAQGARHQAQ